MQEKERVLFYFVKGPYVLFEGLPKKTCYSEVKKSNKMDRCVSRFVISRRTMCKSQIKGEDGPPFKPSLQTT